MEFERRYVIQNRIERLFAYLDESGNRIDGNDLRSRLHTILNILRTDDDVEIATLYNAAWVPGGEEDQKRLMQDYAKIYGSNGIDNWGMIKNKIIAKAVDKAKEKINT